MFGRDHIQEDAVNSSRFDRKVRKSNRRAKRERADRLAELEQEETEYEMDHPEF